MGGEEVCLPQDGDTLSSRLFSAQPLLSPSEVRLFLADSNQLEGSVCV